MSLFELKSYQKETVEYGVKNPYFISALQQGLGKSLTSLCIADETKSLTLIVCPSYLMLKWKSEINKFFPEKTVSVLDSDKKFYNLFDTDIAIIGYYFIDKADMLFEWADLVVFDEAHMLKTMNAKRTEAAHRLIYENSTKRLHLLTGTPILNRVHEFYSLITLCQYNPKIEESAFLQKFPTYVDFANHFSNLKEFEINTARGRKTVQQWEGYKNEDELKRWLNGIYIRFEADKVLDLPPFLDIEVPVEYKENPELLEAFEQFSATGENNSIMSRVKAQAALAKAPFTAEYAKNLIEQDIQVVIYSDHPEAAKLIAEKLGITAITGETPMHNRQAMADRFQSGEARALSATIGSFSTGIDLYSACHMIFNDPNFVPGNMKQTKARIRRIGQKQRCTFHFIVGSYQDEVIYKKLAEKEKTIQAIV